MLRRLLLILLFATTVFAGTVFANTEDDYVPVEYDCDGGTTEFTFSWPIGDTSEVEVILKLTSTEVEMKLIENTDYTVSATSNDYSNGGTVTTIPPAYANTYTLTIRRDTARSQDAILEDTRVLRLSAIEDGLDKLTRLVQDLQEIVGRCLKIPKTETNTVDLVSIENRADKNITFGAEGDVTVTSVLSTGTANISPWGETLIDDGDAEEARRTLELYTTDDVEFAGITGTAITGTTGIFTDLISTGTWIDVRAYGAVGDGATNDSAAIQAALDSLSTTGGIVFLAPLTFRIDTGLVVPVGVHIQIIGCGSNSVIYYTGTLNAITATGTIGNRAMGTYRDFKILGNANMDCGIEITYGTRRMNLKNICVESFNGNGIKIITSWNLGLQHCDVRSGTGNGIYITGAAGYGNNMVLNCNCESITGNGLLVEFVAIQIIGGIYEANTVNNIYLKDVRGFTIDGVYIETQNVNGDAHGIYIGGGADIARGGTITGCEIERGYVETGTGVPIYLRNAQGVFIAGNHIMPHKDVAGLTGIPHITIREDCKNIQIGHNDFRGTSEAGLFANPCQSVAVTDGATGISIINRVIALADNATPCISRGKILLTGGVTTITDFDDGVTGEIITILCKHSLTFDFETVQDADHNLDGSSVNITADTGDILKFLCEDGTTWHLISYSDASEDNN